MERFNDDKILIEASVGELLDKISILEIKRERIRDPEKLMNVEKELVSLMAVKREKVVFSESTRSCYLELKSVNEALWDIEDEIRECEKRKDFGDRFVQLARSVYKQNDLRCKLKRDLNLTLGSRLVEEKSYTEYSFS